MSKTRLAILGGAPVRTKPFPIYNSIGQEEKDAAREVLDSGVLSQFLGTWHRDFYGGPRVQRLEKEWATYFGVKHAISMNSATSGLYACVGALGIEPGDEVIVSPYTMTASVTGVLVYGGVPVFADIDPETYCLDAKSIEKRITKKTKAIITVDLFGHPADDKAIRALAEKHKLKIIEDAAQAPGAKIQGKWAGTCGDMGVFSLNYHKTIHCGEGGVVVTNNDELANRLQLIRNHAEAVVKAKGDTADTLLGFNYRLGEIEAAIAREQLKKLESLTRPRIEAAEFLRDQWSQIPGLTPARPKTDVRHVYYVFAFQFDSRVIGISRDRFLEAVKAEGVTLNAGYVEPIYLQPLYQRKKSPLYKRGICPVTESMHFEKLFYTTLIHAGLSKADLQDVATAVKKVAGEVSLLKKSDPTLVGKS